jgi:hypothetical protein
VAKEVLFLSSFFKATGIGEEEEDEEEAIAMAGSVEDLLLFSIFIL